MRLGIVPTVPYEHSCCFVARWCRGVRPRSGRRVGCLGRGFMHGSFGGTLVARAQSVVVALVLLGVGSGRSFQLGVCRATPRRSRS
jgi:hypothetical protein